MLGLFYPYGVILQALAIVHFMRRRPDGYWLWIILLGGGIGAFAYLIAEVLPDAALLRGTFNAFPRRKRIRQLEAEVLENPSIGNFEELGDLLLEDEQVHPRPRVLRPRHHASNRYGGSGSTVARSPPSRSTTGRRPLPICDRVAGIEAKYDYHRAAGLRAHALAQVGREEEALALFAEATATSTLSETQVPTSPASSPPGAGRPRHANGRSASWPRERRAGLRAPAERTVVPEGVSARAGKLSKN